MSKIILKINNVNHTLDLQGNETLLEILRLKLGLTGTKTACEESECGTCTVRVNGKAVLSCIMLACDLQGDDIQTIEGVAQGERLHPVQQAFLECGAVQCGFCIPGMIMSAKSLLESDPSPSQEKIEYALDGNICRCAGYPKIFEAVRRAGELMKQGWSSSQPVEIANAESRPKMDGMTRGITYEEYAKGLNK